MFRVILLAAVFSLNMLSAATQVNFDTQMEQAIQKAEDETKKAQNNATRRDMAPTWNTKLELENAILQLEVKKTLVNNFKNTESLNSQAVRDKLLQVLNKPMITTADLADLQNLVLQEKARMKEEKAQGQ